MVKIAPSILAADYLNLQNSLDSVKGADYLHLDIMDGNFVPNISMGADFVRACKRASNIPCEVHLMIDEPIRLLESFIEAGSDVLTIHVESTRHVYKGIQMIKEANILAGVALNPGTSLLSIEPFIEELDLLLIMTVNPGFGGQRFIKNMMRKIEGARQLIDQSGKDILLAVDGGVKEDNALQIIDAGANMLIAGSAIFTDNTVASWESFSQLVREKQ